MREANSKGDLASAGGRADDLKVVVSDADAEPLQFV